MTRLFILDLDRTSFNTHLFVDDLIRFMEQTYNLDPATYGGQIKRYSLPNEMGYDFYAHATTATSQSRDNIHNHVLKHFNDADYTYADVKPWADQRQANGDQILIATVGELHYQTLKLELAPPLRALPRAIVNQNKGSLLRTALDHRETGERPAPDNPLSNSLASFPPNVSITLIDDNPLTFTKLGPHPAVQQIRLARPNEKFTTEPAPAHVTTITSLKELV